MDLSALFKNLSKTVQISQGEVELLFNLSKVRQLKKKEHLFVAGDLAKYVGFVNKGCLKYYQLNEKGEIQIVYFATEDWWIGDLSSFYSGQPTQFNLQALEPCQLFLYTKESFDKARSEISSFDNYCKIRHAKATDARLANMMSERSDTAEIRYLDLLSKIPDIFQRVPQRLIASFLGIQPQSLSRIRKQLALKSSKSRV